MDETLTGFKEEGSWADIVELGERITTAFKELDAADTEAFEEWDHWRPKPEERLRKDINEKTADQASVAESSAEKDGKAPNTDLKKAGKKLSESGASDTPKNAAKDIHKSMRYALRAVDTLGRKALRRIEGTVYQHVMTKVSPYYFDNELISANATRVSDLTGDKNVFRLEVNINGDELSDKVKEAIADLDEVDRWHMDISKNVESAADAEGHESTKADETTSETNTSQVVSPDTISPQHPDASD